jgi:hypothetical protein
MTTLRDHAKRFADEGRESGPFAKLNEMLGERAA